jgi:hypothetical protein
MIFPQGIVKKQEIKDYETELKWDFFHTIKASTKQTMKLVGEEEDQKTRDNLLKVINLWEEISNELYNRISES